MVLVNISFPQNETFSPPETQKKTGELFSFDFISMNVGTFDGITNDKDAIHVLKYCAMSKLLLKNEGRKDGMRKGCFFAIIRK